MPSGATTTRKNDLVAGTASIRVWFTEAVAAGGRKALVCLEMGLTLRTLQRWTERDTLSADARTTTVRPVPSNALSEDERSAILVACNRPEHAHLPPSQLVPRLADQGCYLGSEATFYRVLREADQQHRRGRNQAPRRRARPTTYAATAANQVWSWDITYCTPSQPPAISGVLLEHVWNALPGEVIGHALPLLREEVSRSGGDLPDTGKVTKSVGNGACGEAITPR